MRYPIARSSRLRVLLGDDDVEFLEYPLAQIDDAPANNAMDRRDRPALDHGRNGRPLRIVEPRRLSGRLAVDQAVRAISVELQHPVANDLQRHIADRTVA